LKVASPAAALALVFLCVLATPTAADEKARAVVQNGLDGYAGCAITPDVDLIELNAEKGTNVGASGGRPYIQVRFDKLDAQLRPGKARVTAARLELMFVYEWWTGYKHELRCADAAPDGTLGSSLTIFGERLPKEKATPAKTWVGWDLPPELVQRWLDKPDTNAGLKITFASSELLDKDKGGGKEVGFLGMGRHLGLARYSPRLVIEYEGDLAPEAPVWVTDLAAYSGMGPIRLQWKAGKPEGAVVDIEALVKGAWTKVAEGLPAAPAEFAWKVPAVGGWKMKLRIRARVGDKASRWTESAEFSRTEQETPFRLGALPTVLKVRREAPVEYALEPVARIELARNEEEGVQLILHRAMNPVNDVRVEATDLTSADGKVIPAADVRVRPVGFVFATNHGQYFTSRDGWFADVLLEVGATGGRPIERGGRPPDAPTFDLEPGTVQPVWISYRAGKDTPAGTYRGKLVVSAKGREAGVIPLEVTVWDFALPVRGKLGVMVGGGIDVKALGLAEGSPEAKELLRKNEEMLLDHRMTPIWVLNRFSWTRALLPKNADGTFDFTEFDAQVERLLARGMSRFVVALASRPGKFGFADDYSEQWKTDLRAYLKATCAHLDRKGWLDLACFYSIDEAPQKDWPRVKMLYKLVKDVEPRLKVFLTLNEPSGVASLADFADVFNVNVRQYHKSRIAEVKKIGKTTTWYVCCWPNENPNLFTEYPGIDPRVIGWMTWKFGMDGFSYWASTAWTNAFERMGDKRCIDDVVSPWNTQSFGAYNGDGCLIYPGPGGTLLCSTRFENLRDGFEDYELLAMLREAVDKGKLTGKDRQRAEELLKVDDRIADMQFGYDLDGRKMLEARHEIGEMLSKVK
jgi:hypothetical protein